MPRYTRKRRSNADWANYFLTKKLGLLTTRIATASLIIAALALLFYLVTYFVHR